MTARGAFDGMRRRAPPMWAPPLPRARARVQGVAVPAARRRAGGGAGRTSPPLPPLFDPATSSSTSTTSPLLPVHVTHLFPFAPTPFVLFPRPGRLLVARSRVPLAPSPLFIPLSLPAGGRRRAQDTAGSPVSPAVSCPPFASALLGRSSRRSPTPAPSSRVPWRRVQRCLVKKNISSSPNVVGV